jgi:uncharacterized protein
MDHRHWPLKYFPSRDKVLNHPLLAKLGPILHSHHLWHKSRRGIAMGFAVGTFIGLLVPFAQIPIAGGISIALRANLPATVAATFVTNPLTTPVIYYGAYHLGAWVTGERRRPKVPPTPADGQTEEGTVEKMGHQIMAMGRPVLVGLSIISTLGALISYYGIQWLWRWRVLTKRKRFKLHPFKPKSD